jgi:hypothetical protein
VTSYSEILEQIRAFVRVHWAEEPADVCRLRDTVLPPGGRWAGTFFVNLILLWSAQNILLLRALAKEGTVSVANLTVITSAYLRQLADWLAHWRMDDTCRLARDAAQALESNPAGQVEEFAEVLAQVGIALNRVQNWIDAYVPWAQLDTRLPELSADKAPGFVHCA